MTLNDYIALAVRTDSTRNTTPEWRMLHAAVGLATEMVELRHATSIQNEVEELGDLSWYWAIAMDTARVPKDERDSWQECVDLFEDCPIPKRRTFMLDRLDGQVGWFLDMMKKTTFYRVPLDHSLAWRRLMTIHLSLRALAEHCCTSYEDVCWRNINKLKVRYPEKYSHEAAANRNLDAEAQALAAK